MSRGWWLVAIAGAVLAVADAVVSAVWPYPIATSEAVLHVAVVVA